MVDTITCNISMVNINDDTSMKNHYKIQNPLFSRYQLQERYATATIFSKVTIFEGYNIDQCLNKIDLGYCASHGMVSESKGHQAIIDFFVKTYSLSILSEIIINADQKNLE